MKALLCAVTYGTATTYTRYSHQLHTVQSPVTHGTVTSYIRYSHQLHTVQSLHLCRKAFKHRIIAQRFVIAAPLVSSSITINVARYLHVTSGTT